jgi:hypothetical protein
MKHSKSSSANRISTSRTSTPEPSHDRKALQLCSQVRYALEYAIGSVLDGDHGVTVLDVVPAPNTSHMLVLVQCFDILSFDESLKLAAELTANVNVLRAAVSEAIHRRKTPGLSFQVVPRLPIDS